ncbi:MAG: nitrate ABC transporter permease [Pseudomonadota bacterium]
MTAKPVNLAMVVREERRAETRDPTPRSRGAPRVTPAGVGRKPESRLAAKTAAALTSMSLAGLTFLIVLGAWAFMQEHIATELPTPGQTWDRAVELLANPFYDNGPNDKGIGWQLAYSLARVGAGFGLAALVGIPVGFLMGMSVTFHRAWQPLIQVLRPVSPLAWLPIGLLLFKAVNPSAVFVIFITSIWPMIINTAAGVRAVPKDYLNVAAVLKLGPLEVARKVMLPAALPYVITGMRLSLGIAWMVIVAAEMLTGGIGIGFFVWDEWNNLSVPSIIVAIVLIGAVGIVLEAVMNALSRRFDYNAR